MPIDFSKYQVGNNRSTSSGNTYSGKIDFSRYYVEPPQQPKLMSQERMSVDRTPKVSQPLMSVDRPPMSVAPQQPRTEPLIHTAIKDLFRNNYQNNDEILELSRNDLALKAYNTKQSGKDASKYERSLAWVNNAMQPDANPVEKLATATLMRVARKGTALITGFAGAGSQILDTYTTLNEGSLDDQIQQSKRLYEKTGDEFYKKEIEKYESWKKDPSKFVTREKSNQVKKWVSEQGLSNPTLSEKVFQSAPSMFSFALLSAVTKGSSTAPMVAESLMEASSVYEDKRNSGVSKEEAGNSFNKAFIANIILNKAVNIFELSGKDLTRWQSALAGTPMETIQEFGQQIIYNANMGIDWLEGALESGLIGGILGFGGGFALGGSPTETTTQKPGVQSEEKQTKEQLKTVSKGQQAGEPLAKTYFQNMKTGEIRPIPESLEKKFSDLDNQGLAEGKDWHITSGLTQEKIDRGGLTIGKPADEQLIKTLEDNLIKPDTRGGVTPEPQTTQEIPTEPKQPVEQKKVKTSEPKTTEIEVGKDGKVEVLDLINKLKEKVDSKNIKEVETAISAVDNLKLDAETKNLSIKSIKKLGYPEIARYLEFIDSGNTRIRVSNTQLNKILGKKSTKKTVSPGKEPVKPTKTVTKKATTTKVAKKTTTKPGKSTKTTKKAEKSESFFKFLKRDHQTSKATETLKPASSPQELKTRIDQLNKFAQSKRILRRTGGIKGKNTLGQFAYGENLPSEGQVRLKNKVVKNLFDYMEVLAHELGHAIDKAINGTTDRTFDILGKISKEDRFTVEEELKAITHKFVGEATARSKPNYYYKPTELFARYWQLYMITNGNLNEIAPKTTELIEKASIKHPIIAEYLEVAQNGIDKGFPSKLQFLPDLRGIYRKHLGKRVGDIAYNQEIVHRAMQERAKKVITDFVAKKFEGIKDDPADLFRAVESIKVTKKDKPVFGTRDFLTFNEAELEQAEQLDMLNGLERVSAYMKDGEEFTVFAKPRYTPKQAKEIYNSLSAKGKKLVRDFTTERKDAKDYFNREVIKDVNKIESTIEGWVHHYFPSGKGQRSESKLRFRDKQALTRRKRGGRLDSGAEGYVLDFQKAMTKVMVDLESEKAFNDFIEKQFATVTKPLAEGEKPDPGWVEVIGTTKKGVGTAREKKTIIIKDGKKFVAKQQRYQMPKDIYERYRLWKGLIDEASSSVRLINDLNRYWRINVLAHPGTATTNFISGGIQFTSKVLTDFYTETLTGNIKYNKTKQNISAMLKVLMPKGWMEAEDWVYGGDTSNFYGQFTDKPGLVPRAINTYGDKALKLFSTYERYWKKVIATSENVKDLKKLNKITKEGLRLPTQEEKDLIAQINEQVDLYAYDYDNVPLWLQAHQKSVIGQSVKPFAKYPYKYFKHITNLAGSIFDRTLPWEERTAKLLSLATIASAYALLKYDRDKEKETPEPGEKTPERLSPRGRLFITKDENGKELFVRVAKYPFLNLTEAGMQLVDGNWESAKDIFSDTIGSIAPIGEAGLLALGYRNDYDKYTEVPIILGDTMSTFVPGFRLLNDVSRMLDPFQRKQTSFWQTFTKLIPTTNEDLQNKLHGEKRTVQVPVEGGVKKNIGESKARTTSDRVIKNYWQDILLSTLSGIYMTRIDPTYAKAFLIREKKNEIDTIKTEILDAVENNGVSIQHGASLLNQFLKKEINKNELLKELGNN